VETFLEKPRPEEIDTDLINAGLYVLEPDVLELIPPDRAVSIEREAFHGCCEGRSRDRATRVLARRRNARSRISRLT
jgi:NDP-sugar pyrophosphorylase family protein